MCACVVSAVPQQRLGGAPPLGVVAAGRLLRLAGHDVDEEVEHLRGRHRLRHVAGRTACVRACVCVSLSLSINKT